MSDPEPRSVITKDGMVVIREVDGEVEECRVPAWAARHIYRQGRKHDYTRGIQRGIKVGLELASTRPSAALAAREPAPSSMTGGVQSEKEPK